MLRWDEYTDQVERDSNNWATTPRGWLFANDKCVGFYLDYGPNHYRSPHQYCRPNHLCCECQPGNVLAVVNGGGSRYVETLDQAKQFVESGVTQNG